jgi:probable HAF family extracellular repeat protein
VSKSSGIRWKLPALMAFILSTADTLAASPSYRVEILPVPAGCQSYSLLHGLGEHDRFVGVLMCDDFVAQRAIIWDRGVITELGNFGGSSSFAYGLSPQGEVVGVAETPEIYSDTDHFQRPFLWMDGTLQDLGTLGGPLGGAVAINADRTIVGTCQPAHTDPRLGRLPHRACVWENDTVRDLGDLGGPDAFALDIDGRGWIVGSSNTTEPLPSGLGFAEHAFLFDGKMMQDLGTLGGLSSVAYSINERGDVVGFSSTEEPQPQTYPVTHAFLWRDGTLIDLGTLGGPFSEAFDINDRGQIVGWSLVRTPNGGVDRRAVMWDGNRIIDLNDVVQDSGGWVLRQARAIDERGRILVNATQGIEQRVVVLIPIARE